MKYKKITKDELERVYVKNTRATVRSAAMELGITHNTMDKALVFHGILPKEKIRGLRPRESMNPFIRDKVWLRKRYVEDERSIRQIAEEIGSTMGNIHSALTWAKIPIKEGVSKRFPEGRKGKLATNWRGGRVITKKYIWIYKPDHPNARSTGYMQEHRLIMEEHLGRVLEPKELVHHINGDPKDNRIENLKLASSKKEHSAMHFDAVKEVQRLRRILDENKIKY
jgi:hypothetical protein